MKYFLTMMFITAILVIVGCSIQTSTHFSGEGDNWVVQFTSHGENATYDIQYRGEEPIPENINYSIASFSVTGRELSEDGYVENEDWGTSVDENNEEIDVTIEWNDESESFSLKQE